MALKNADSDQQVVSDRRADAALQPCQCTQLLAADDNVFAGACMFWSKILTGSPWSFNPGSATTPAAWQLGPFLFNRRKHL